MTKDAMTNRERFRAVMNFEPFDRLPIIEWAGWWNKTKERWEQEGAPAGLDNIELTRWLGLDPHYQAWIRGGAYCSKRLPPRSGHGQGIVTTMDDYIANIEPHLFPFPLMDDDWPIIDSERWTWMANKQVHEHAVIWFTLDGFFWLPRHLFGIENHLFAFYDEPELMHRINRANAEWMLKAINGICEICTPDFMTFAEDMSYNNGPMLSKELFDEFMKPYYEMVLPKLKERGIKTVIDSDGDIHAAAFWFEEAGLEGILPLERQAGVDMARLREEHPDMFFIGAYDKMVMNKGEQAMRKEFERLLPVASKGGYIISCDHQTPPGVSLEDYKLYLDLFREYAVCS